MGGSAASEAILFIGSVAAAAALAGALAGVAGHFTAGLRDRSNSLEAELTSRLAIVNDPAHVPTGPLLLYVKNTGSSDLQLPSLAVLVDGKASANWDATVGGAPATHLKPGQLATLAVNDLAVPAGDHHAVIVIGPGATAT